MKIPFIKAEGAGNDFLITSEDLAPALQRVQAARALCHRHLGVGADGWYLVRVADHLRHQVPRHAGMVADAVIHLYNSDGSEAELSGNGTRCVVAWLASQFPGVEEFIVETGAGLRRLRVLERNDVWFRIGMQMGKPTVFPEETIELDGDAGISVKGNRVDPGNPQFAVEVADFAFPWKERGRLLEAHPAFPQRSNISFYRSAGPNRIEARFYERGAGATLSSGTGSTGALAAAVARGLLVLPAVVETEAGPLRFQEEEEGLVLEGTATLVAEGIFNWHESASNVAK